MAGKEGQNGLYASAVIDDKTDEYIVKVANTSGSPRELTLKFDGLKKSRKFSDGHAITLSADDPDADNTVDNPSRIVPSESRLTVDGNTIPVTIPAKTFAVYILK